MNNEIVVYQPNEALKLEVRLENETVWLNQQQMSELFQTTRNNVTLHIRNVFKEKELDEVSVCKESLLTAADGKEVSDEALNPNTTPLILVGGLGTRISDEPQFTPKPMIEICGKMILRHIMRS